MTNEQTKDVILIVDDVPINIAVLLAVLGGAGFEVLVAIDGESAIEQALYAMPDIILLDIMMPGIDGFETCVQLKADEKTRDIPVIFMTALTDTNDKVKGFQVGAIDYITKPLQHEEVLARVKTHLTICKLQRALQKSNEDLEQRVAQRTQELANEVKERRQAQDELEIAYERLVEYNLGYSRFVPAELLQLLNRDTIIDVQLGDHAQMEMTLLFADIRSFTSLSESMTPKETFTFINTYLSRVSPIIRTHYGFIDKYMGDGIMAIFPRKADDAVQAAIDIQYEVMRYNEDRRAQGYDPIRVGIGLHTGYSMLGTIGEEERMEGTVISDTVNLASRLEGLTKVYHVNIIVSVETLNKLEDADRYHFRFLGIVQVKGKEEPVSVFEVLDGYPEIEIDRCMQTQTMFEEGLHLYYNKHFAEASIRFNEVLDRNVNDRAARLYLERSAMLMVNGVTENWHGVETMTEK